MLVGLAIVFGIIILIDNTIQNSPSNIRKQKEAEERGRLRAEMLIADSKRRTEEYIKRCEATGLPPSMWR